MYRFKSKIQGAREGHATYKIPHKTDKGRAPHSVSWRPYNENALVSGVVSGIPACFSRAYIYTRTHSEETRSDAKTTRARVSRPELVSVGVVSRITRPPPLTYTHPLPRGTDVTAMSPTTARLARHSVPTRVRSESTPHHERATKALPNSFPFPHSPSSFRWSTSSHTLCSACRSSPSHPILGAGHFDFQRVEHILATSNSALGQAERDNWSNPGQAAAEASERGF